MSLTAAEVVSGEGRPEPPEMPPLDPMAELRARGLAAIHRWHLQQVGAIAALIGDIRAGLRAPDGLAAAVRGMPMAQALRLTGTACGQECRMLTGHHQIEDRALFPAVAAAGGTLWAAILDRLRAEHRVIEDAIETLAAAAEALEADPAPARLAPVDDAFAALESALRSHFRWEETRLAPALGHYGIEV